MGEGSPHGNVPAFQGHAIQWTSWRHGCKFPMVRLQYGGFIAVLSEGPCAKECKCLGSMQEAPNRWKSPHAHVLHKEAFVCFMATCVAQVRWERALCKSLSSPFANHCLYSELQLNCEQSAVLGLSQRSRCMYM